MFARKVFDGFTRSYTFSGPFKVGVPYTKKSVRTMPVSDAKIFRSCNHLKPADECHKLAAHVRPLNDNGGHGMVFRLQAHMAVFVKDAFQSCLVFD